MRSTFLAVLILTAGQSFAENTILTVTTENADTEMAFTRDELLELPQHQLVTATTVTDGASQFEGFLIRDLLETSVSEGDTVVATALNTYQIEIPFSDFEKYDVIGAMSMDGNILSPRDKGPVWIVYPRDDHAELQDIRYDTRWVWQLVSLHVQ